MEEGIGGGMGPRGIVERSALILLNHPVIINEELSIRSGTLRRMLSFFVTL